MDIRDLSGDVHSQLPKEKLKLRITDVYNMSFCEETANKYLELLKDFNPTKKQDGTCRYGKEYAIYVDIKTVNQLYDITQILGNPIVFGEKYNGEKYKNDIIIENYNGYRE